MPQICNSTHNCASEAEAKAQGDDFINDHQSLLEGFTIVRWQDFLASRCQETLNKRVKEIADNSHEGSHFYLKMKKTWEKCLSATQSLDASMRYQREEYAAVLCMDEFDHLFYPKRITNGLAYLYNYFGGKKPQYHHIKLSETKILSQQELINSLNIEPAKKDRRHIHVAFRALLEHMNDLLSSGELSDKAKKVFAEEAENVLMAHGLLGAPLINDKVTE